MSTKPTSEELYELFGRFIDYKFSFVPKHSYGYGVGINSIYSLSLYFQLGEGHFILTEPFNHKVEISLDEYNFLLQKWRDKFETFNIGEINSILNS